MLIPATFEFYTINIIKYTFKIQYATGSKFNIFKKKYGCYLLKTNIDKRNNHRLFLTSDCVIVFYGNRGLLN